MKRHGIRQVAQENIVWFGEFLKTNFKKEVEITYGKFNVRRLLEIKNLVEDMGRSIKKMQA